MDESNVGTCRGHIVPEGVPPGFPYPSSSKSMGDPRFHALLAEIAALHDKKAADYGTDADPFANVRASAGWGISPWLGVLVRMGDKIARLQQFAKKGTLVNESAEDSLLDLAVYSLINIVLLREERDGKS